MSRRYRTAQLIFNELFGHAQNNGDAIGGWQQNLGTIAVIIVASGKKEKFEYCEKTKRRMKSFTQIIWQFP